MRPCLASLPLLLTILLVPTFGWTNQAFAQDDAQRKQDIQQLGGELKAARLFGLLDDEQAEQMYFEILEFQFGEEKGAEGDGKGKDGREMDEDDKRRGGMTFARFIVRDGGDFTTLLRPEFLPRDVELMTEAVAEDPAMIAVIESLLEDYQREFEEKSRAFQDSLDLARAGYEFDLVDQTLSLIPEVPMSREEVDRRVDVWNAEKGLGRRDPAMVADWANRMISSLQTRVRKLREVIAARSAEIEAQGGAPSARELLAKSRQA